jgi:hypothetical protein
MIPSKLPISIGILAWKSGQTLVDTLTSYYEKGLFKITDDIRILFQEQDNEDEEIANHFNLPYVGLPHNIGIGKGFIHLSNLAKYDNILLLEHDWHLIESMETTFKRLQEGISYLSKGFTCVKYRHRENPGYPLYTLNAYKDKELDHYCDNIQLFHPHLLDSIHWMDPSKEHNDKIQKENEYFMTTARYSNWTNNPCLFKTRFYIDTVCSFVEKSLLLEDEINYWWSRQNFKVAQGEGLFTHKDIKKFGK